MFGQTPRTPYDIEFSLLGIPARVHPLFWAMTLLFGWRLGSADLVVIWVMCVFVSIVIHEMGHALVARFFGYYPHIVLHHFGGYASYQPDRRHTLWKSVAIIFAGPLAGFLFYGLLILIQLLLMLAEVEVSRPVWIMFSFLEFINLYWGLVNLLPVLPLDGGQICRDLLNMFRRVDGELWALRISVFTGFAMALLFIRMEMTFAAIMFGLLAFTSLQTLGNRNSSW